MNKTELIKKVAEKAGLSQADSKKAVEATFEAVKEALVGGESVALIGFGTFSVNQRAARKGFNPRLNQQIDIEAKKVAKFKAGAEFTNALNK